MTADEDANLRRLDELAERIAANGPYAFGQMRTFLHSLPVAELERLREWPPGKTREGANDGEEESRDRVSRQPDL